MTIFFVSFKKYTDKAIENFEKLLELWKDTDSGLPEVDDAKKKLDRAEKTERNSLMIELAIFILFSILLLAFTLSRTHRHRFPRFFAFESLVALVILNSKSWFRDPLSLRQLISWILLASSLALAIHAFRLLHIAGSPEGDIEDTTKLVTIGAYRYIRHPLYCSLLLGGVGAFLKAPSILGFVLFALVFLFVYVTAKVEEKDDIEKFGDDYLAYMKKTKMFLPFLI